MNNIKGNPIINGDSITANYQVLEFRDVAPNGLNATGQVIGYARTAAFEYHSGTNVLHQIVFIRHIYLIFNH